MRYVNILNVALAIVCLIVIMNPISASDKPDEIDSYLQLKKKYDDFKYRKNIPDFESPEFKKYEESAQQDSAIIYPQLKKYFAKHITINGIDLSNTDLVPAFLPGYSESYCIDGIHENLNNYDTTFVITDMRLVKNWLKRNHKNTSIQIKDLMSSDLICDDAAHVSLSEISLPNTQKFDKVYCSVNGITQDATPGQPDELTVIGEKGSIIFICWISLNGNFKNFKTDMVLRNKWKQKAISLLDLVTFVK